MRYYIDVDGTLVRKTTSTDLADWTTKVRTKARPLNLTLLKWLKERKIEGHDLVLWTNRSPELKEATYRNLGKWATLFSDAHFMGDGWCGKRWNSVEGVVIDDEARFARCGQRGSFIIDWK